MPAPPIIFGLVARFSANLDSYKRGQYNETQVRQVVRVEGAAQNAELRG